MDTVTFRTVVLGMVRISAGTVAIGTRIIPVPKAELLFLFTYHKHPPMIIPTGTSALPAIVGDTAEGTKSDDAEYNLQ